MLRWFADIFQYLFELITAPLRLAGFWRETSAYDEHGYFKFLKEREFDQDAFTVDGVDSGTIDKALGIFCEAFDILPEQKFCLRPKDKIMTIYCAMVTGCWDEQEMERLSQRLESETSIPLTEEDLGQFDTLEDLVVWYHLNHRDGTGLSPEAREPFAREQDAVPGEVNGSEHQSEPRENETQREHQDQPDRGLSF